MRVHYGVEGELRFYKDGRVEVIKSQAGVHQGDPLGSVLFALAIHDILKRVGREFDVHVFAYADNITIVGKWAEARDAVGRLKEWLRADGLELNAMESECFFPCARVQLATVLLEDRTRISVVAEGLKVLGGAIGESAFCSTVFQKQVNRALEDLVWLKWVPHLHIWAKQ